MPSGEPVAEVLKTAEAAQANRGGLERSSYTWQVRRCLYVAGWSKCQGFLRRALAHRGVFRGPDKRNFVFQIRYLQIAII